MTEKSTMMLGIQKSSYGKTAKPVATALRSLREPIFKLKKEHINA